VQWMTAGSGVLHKEYHDKEYSKIGGPFQMVQLWVNLPAKDKMTAPKYQGIKQSEMGKLPLQAGGFVDVIAGTLNGVKGPASTFTPIEMYKGDMQAGEQVSFELPASYNTGILVVEGELVVHGETTVPADHFALFLNDGEMIEISTSVGAKFLVLSGEPILENLVPYGPFLMNTKEEIMQAYADLNAGKFGHLED